MDRLPTSRWLGKIIGIIAGLVMLRASPVLGALVGLLIGHAFDAGWLSRRREDPYRVLGLTAEASDAEVDLARRRLLALHHPDRADGGAPRGEASRKAGDINAAYARIKAMRRR